MAASKRLKRTMGVGAIIVSILWAIATITTVYILWKELQKRGKMKQNTTRNQTNIVSSYLRYTSLCTLIIVCICCIFGFISGLPIICQYTLSLSIATRFISYLPMELYQLSRLHYCFSEQSSHSKKAYPIWIFKSVLIFAVILTIQLFIAQSYFINLNG